MRSRMLWRGSNALLRKHILESITLGFFKLSLKKNRQSQVTMGKTQVFTEKTNELPTSTLLPFSSFLKVWGYFFGWEKSGEISESNAHCLVVHGKIFFGWTLAVKQDYCLSVLKKTSKKKASSIQISKALGDHRWFQSMESWILLLHWSDVKKKAQLELGLRKSAMWRCVFFWTTFSQTKKNRVVKAKKLERKSMRNLHRWLSEGGWVVKNLGKFEDSHQEVLFPAVFYYF